MGRSDSICESARLPALIGDHKAAPRAEGARAGQSLGAPLGGRELVCAFGAFWGDAGVYDGPEHSAGVLSRVPDARLCCVPPLGPPREHVVG